MNFLPIEEQRMAVEGFTRFLETELRPIVERYQPDKLIEKELMLEIFQKMLPYGMGGNGITKDFGVELLFRNARMMPIPDGTTEIQKLIIGRALTGINAFS